MPETAPSPPLLRALLLLHLVLLAVRPAAAQGFFPCHPSKATPNNEVACTRVVLPPLLCKRCPLRPVAPNGQFRQCNRIYDSETPDCLRALEQYVAENQCDTARAEALAKFKLDPRDDDARMILDYFLYSVCEECCDCVPMGVKRTDYVALASSHSATDPALWTETRGNCPAHAQFDVCKVLPQVTYFTSPGGPEIDAPPACPMLRDWQNSPQSNQWELNPRAELVPEIVTFLRGLLNAIDCDNFAIWNSCHAMEQKQKHLEIPRQFAEFEPEIPDTPAPTTTTATTTTATATTATTATTTSPEDSSPTTPAENPDPDDSDGPPSDTSNAAVGDDNASSEPSANGSPSASESASGSGSGASSTANAGAATSERRTCFPGTARVELSSGRTIAISQLQIGDMIRASETSFSEVYLFSHRTTASAVEYIRLYAGNYSITTTSGHLLPVQARGMVRASEIRIGDSLRTMSGMRVVHKRQMVQAEGLYNPHTLAGEMVVDGIVASCYTSAVARVTATALLAPFRALFGAGVLREQLAGSWLSHGVAGGFVTRV